VFVKADGSAGGVRFADLLGRANLRLVTAIGRSEATFGDPQPKFSTHSFGCHFVEITWQPEIARLRVSRVVTVIDAGRIVNPLAGRNQVEGSVVMGIGMALLPAFACANCRSRSRIYSDSYQHVVRCWNSISCLPVSDSKRSWSRCSASQRSSLFSTFG
jgi:methylaspartate ammonia-lyase